MESSVTAKVCFISLGPTCVAAEILKASGLRTCTFGFDWCRSGSKHLKDFLELPLDDFLHRHVYNPNIPLTQASDPRELSTLTSEPVPLIPLYGYQYILNPHRDIREPSTLQYHKRTFGRLKRVLSLEEVRKVFVVADYADKQGARHLDNVEEIERHINDAIMHVSIKNFSLEIIRIHFFSSTSSAMLTEIHPLSRAATLNKIYLHEALDLVGFRHKMYNQIGRKVLRGYLSGKQLWSA